MDSRCEQMDGEMTSTQDSLSWQACGGYADIKISHATLVSNRSVYLGSSRYIARINHNGLITYRANRNWKHIKERSKYFYDLWFPTRGSIVINQNNQCYEVRSDEYAITYANKPLNIAIKARKGEVFEAYLVAVPAHQLQDYIPNCELIAGRKFAINSGDTKTAKQTLIGLFSEGQNMSADVISAYMRASLKALSLPMRDECKRTYESCNIRAVRLKAIREVIESNLSNPDLSVAMAARQCGISARYVCLLLNEANLNFSEIVWSGRLDCARRWLQDRSRENIPISRIAYTCGFASASHFSRAFKAKFALTPSEFRKSKIHPVSIAA